MSLLTKILFIPVLLIFSGLMLAQDCKAVLSINSDREDISIFINDTYAGSANSFKTELDVGEYIVRVTENSKKWNAKSFSDTIKITECSEFRLNYLFKDEILLDTDPQNAYVYSGDSLVGYTPLYVKRDFKSLLLKKTDYLSREITIHDVDLNEKIKLDFIGEEENTSFYESTVFKILVGTAIALGAATAYFKLEADDRFEEYKITGDPELLSQTDRLDVISGVSFVALQINFGLLIYLFLSD